MIHMRLLEALESALRVMPGVYRLTRVSGDGRVDDPAWPVGSTLRDKSLRTQVIALMRDEGEQCEP